MFIAAMTVAVTAIMVVSRASQEAQRHSEVLAALDRLKALDASLDRDLLEIVAGLLPHYDTVVDLQHSVDETYAAIASDDRDFSADLREDYGRQLAEKHAIAEQIKGLSAFVINEESYLQFEIPRYAQTAKSEVARLLQTLLITQLGDRTQGWLLFSPDQGLAQLEASVGTDERLSNLLIHFRLLREQHARLHKAVDEYFAINSRPVLEQLRGHYMTLYRDRQERTLVMTQVFTALTIALFAGLGWTVKRLGHAHGEADRSRTRLLDAVNSLQEAFILFDGTDHTVTTNPPYLALMKGGTDGGYAGLIDALRGMGASAELSPSRPNQEQIIHDTRSGRWLLFRSRVTAEGGAVCLLMDLTDHKRMESELRKLTAAVEQSPLSIVITDAEGRIEYVNASFCALTGYEPAEVIGQNPNILNSGKTAPGTFAEMWATIASGMTWRGDVINKTKKGDIFIEHSIVFPIHGFDGGIRHYIALKENVTLLRRNAEMIVDTKADMERLLFAASHDFQEPIRDLLLNIQLLDRRLGETVADEIHGFLASISRSGRQLSLLIKGLLNYNRSIRPMSVLGPVDCLGIVNRAIAEFGSVNSKARFTVGPLPTILGDPVLLSILLENLIGNAVKFARPGIPPEVAITATADAGGWHIEVADNGIGIEPEYLRTIIRPFSRLHARAEYPGAGLGLATAAKIAALHNGRLWLTSEYNRGTTAHLWLPTQAGTTTPDPGRQSSA